MKQKLFPLLITLTALLISISAALFSVIGLAKLFAGIGIAIVIMASSLELAKLVIASVLYQYRNTLGKILKFYLICALMVLMIITSAGIYGYLSQGYSVSSAKIEVVQNHISLLSNQKKAYEEHKAELTLEKQNKQKSISELISALSNSTILQSRDKNGNLITRESKNNRKAFEEQLKYSQEENELLSIDIRDMSDSIFLYESKISELNSELTQKDDGPLKYISKLTGKSMDKVVNWFILVIIFVFDPLAISLVFAANFAFEKIKKKSSFVKEEETKLNFPEGWKEFVEELPQQNIVDMPNETQPNEIQNKINELELLLKQPSLSSLKKFKYEQEIKELKKQLMDPSYVPSSKFTREY